VRHAAIQPEGKVSRGIVGFSKVFIFIESALLRLMGPKNVGKNDLRADVLAVQRSAVNPPVAVQVRLLHHEF
jgi:hypothetical protein